MRENALGDPKDCLLSFHSVSTHRLHFELVMCTIHVHRYGLMYTVVIHSVLMCRLKAKQEEWLEAQKSFNKTWRDQLEKYYLKSLDHQGINFKQTDTRAMRAKSLITELETVFDERQEQLVEGGPPVAGPHLLFSFPSESYVYNDAVGLVMYYTKRASSLQHSDALKIRSFLTVTLADYFFYPR